MAKVSPIQTSFGAGEFSPLLHGQVELDRYRQALDTCLNYIPSLQGGLVRRSGTYFVASTKTSSEKARLVPFEFSTTQAYILEFGDLYIRFYRDYGQITSGGPAYEIATTYTEAELFQLRFTQSADVLYIAHPSHKPATLSRTGNTSWTLADISFTDGPYLPTNTTRFSLTPGAFAVGATTLTTGTTRVITGAANNGAGLIRITSAAHGFLEGERIAISGVTGTVEANGNWNIVGVTANTLDLVGSTFVNAYIAAGTIFPGIFKSTDIGRPVRMQQGTVWGWGTITSFTHEGLVGFTVVSTLTSTATKTFFRLGVWSETTGYPSCVNFHEDRLCFAGATNFPQRIDCSVSSSYSDFSPSALADGSVIASNALSFTFNANDVNVVRWISSDERGLLVGTAGGEWLVSPASTGEALTPSNINAKRSTKYGSANIQAITFGKSVLFVQKSGRKVRELTYFYQSDGFRSTDMTLLAEHITQTGIVEMSVQQEPQPILWGVRADGVMTGLTYERDEDSLRVGWHRHILGGYSDAAGSPAIVESAACIPSPDGSRIDLWLLVKRYVDGAVVRHIEYMKPIFNDETLQRDAFFVDAGLTYDAPLTITGITKADPAVVTSAAHGLSNGDRILLSDILGVDDDDIVDMGDLLNGVTAVVANATANTFELEDLDGNNISTLSATDYVSGGYARKYVTTISGLTHLEGQTVDILADGAVQPSKVVSGGAITLSTRATTVQIGLGYRSDGKMLRLNAGSANGTAIGKIQRTHQIGVMLHRSLGLKIGTSFDDLTTITFRTAADKMSRAPALYTGILSETLEADYDFENQFCFRQDQPLPSMVLALMPQMVTQD